MTKSNINTDETLNLNKFTQTERLVNLNANVSANSRLNTAHNRKACNVLCVLYTLPLNNS